MLQHPQQSKVDVVNKPWGVTRCIHRDATHEVWHASIVGGGFSSRHKHERKPNKFYVLCGRMWVHTFKEEVFGVPQSSVLLGPGDEITIPDGMWHQFEVEQNCSVELIEIYWAYLKGEDIIRAVKPESIT